MSCIEGIGGDGNVTGKECLQKSTIRIFSKIKVNGLTEKDGISVFPVDISGDLRDVGQYGNVDSFTMRQNDIKSHNVRKQINSTGLLWPLDAVNWESGQVSLSNRMTGKDEVTIEAVNGRFLVVLPLGCSVDM